MSRESDEDAPFGSVPEPPGPGVPARAASVPPPIHPTRAAPRDAASRAGQAAWSALGSALSVGPVRRRPGVDVLGISTFRGVGSSASSMVVLVAAAGAVYLAFRVIAILGVWVVILLAWCGIGAVLWRLRSRIDARRLRLLLRKPGDPESGPGA